MYSVNISIASVGVEPLQGFSSSSLFTIQAYFSVSVFVYLTSTRFNLKLISIFLVF